MSQYVNERLANYVPVSQYMGEAFYEQKGYALGVAVGAVGALVLSMVYRKSKGK